MRRTALACLAVAALVLTLVLAQAPPRADAQGPPPGGPPPGGPPPGAMAGMPIDSFIAERDSMTKVVLEQLGDRKGMAAESVFKNLKVIKGRTVEQVLRMMNMGFGRSLGVRCQHCHVLGHWADEDKDTKQITRDMMAMSGRINNELLPAIKNLKSETPGVNCGTCHRGTARPGTGPMASGGPPGGRR